MALFLIHHTHTADLCPARDPEMTRQLSAHVTDANAKKCGVRILSDFVYEPEHSLFLVLEADNADNAMAFAKPFLQVGTVTIKTGATCSQIAEHAMEQMATVSP